MSRIPLRQLLRALIPVGLIAGLLAPASVIAALPAAAATCPCTVFAPGATPAVASENDPAAVEVGMKFRSDVDGAVSGIRFYKGAGNTGVHTGHLWTRDGTLLSAVSFANETGSGWQQASFPQPVPVTAGTTYVISYFAPTGHYAADGDFFATGGVDNSPLHALADGTDGANGLYVYGASGGFPTNTWHSANYWVDPVFTTSAVDTTAPGVTGVSPAAGSAGAPAGSTVSATFTEDVQPGSLGFALRTAAGADVAVTQTYSAASKTATWTPTAALALSTQYTATVTAARDSTGNAMTVPATWSFTTAGPSTCPCSLWTTATTPGTVTEADGSAVELGMKFRANTAGIIRGVRFYKGPQNTGTHTASLWTSTGTRLATATFAGETASGWQQVTFSSPVNINANTTYVVSYHTTVGFYSVDENGFGSAVVTGPLTGLANGTDGSNGLYLYGGGGFPTNSFQASNYYVDPVFDFAGPDTTPPAVVAQVPAPGAGAAPTSTDISATFSEDVQPGTIVLTVTGPGGAAVGGSVGYNATSRTGTFSPSSVLANSTTYSVSLSGTKDTATTPNTMAPVSWSFATAAPPPPPPTQGPGGPVLVVANSASTTSQFSLFTAEILRAEGLNEFATADLGGVTPTTLASYDVVVLGATPLTASQVSMFTTWVNGGGRLIAFRPDKQLAGLLGLTATTSTLANSYLKVNTAAAPGAGITDQTIQFHGTADQYALNGATSVATLYSSATAATTAPAVTMRTVGSGKAAAFTYDLAQSIVYTRQGNPAWAGQERDGDEPIRSDDLYFGGSAATDWVNLAKAQIPQADEQQRLLSNLIGLLDADRTPLPKFWYFPRSLKAVVVATGDDHGTGGTTGRFEQYEDASPAGCSVADWTCPRYTSYMYPDVPLSNSDAVAFRNEGFELALHPQSNCSDFTPSSLESNYSGQLSDFAHSWPGLPAPVTSRFHCIVYSDWATQPRTELRHGIRLDTNYYYYPGSWVMDRPGFMTGSGLPERFADSNGSIIDVYQAATQMTDESGQTYPDTANTLLDNALGPLGYYGAFVANMHTDQDQTPQSTALLTAAQSRGVPLVAASQMLTWLNGRNGSSFGSIAWSGTTLTFTVAAGAGSTGLTGMLPTSGPGGATLTAISRNGAAVSFTRTTIKGVEYAFFGAGGGSYTATYGGTGGAAAAATAARAGASAVSAAAPMPTATAGDTTAPAVSGVSTLALPDGSASVDWTTSENATGVIRYGTAVGALDESAFHSGKGTAHQLVVDDLKPDTTYYYRIAMADPVGNRTVWPVLGSPPATFVTPANGVADRPAATKATTRTRVLDAHAMATWDRATWSVPAGASITVEVRLGSTRHPDATWTPWQSLSAPGARVVGTSRYLQYRITTSARVLGFGVTNNAARLHTPGEV
jgi:Domain of unknown function (DUF4082)/Bacterial Ig-like domain/Purple acid Phosphatase, N-terminal domain